MNRIDEHELQAYVDGELAPEDRARVAAAVVADPALRQRIEREQRLRAQLRGAFDPVLEEPVPARLAALLQVPHASAGTMTGHRDPAAATADNVVALTPRAARSKRPMWHAPTYALAASLAVLAASLWLRADTATVQMQQGGLVARGALAEGLDRALASAPSPGANVTVGLSFRDAGGGICRSFVQHGDAPLTGLACRRGTQWTLQVLSHPAAGGSGEIRQASSALAPEIQAAVDARLQGEVFDAAEERAARDRGWR